MGKVLVLYDSASGNTAKMAGLVAEGAGSIPGIEVRLRKVDEATSDDLLWCDGLALGSPTNMRLLSWKMKRFWDEPMAPHWMKVEGKIACCFSSCGWGGGTELACSHAEHQEAEVEHGRDVRVRRAGGSPRNARGRCSPRALSRY